MSESPYSGFINMCREEARGQIPASFLFGKVVSANPLAVTVSKTNQSGSNLLKSASLGLLMPDDDVLLIPLENNQKFLVLCKVVEA